MDKTSKLSSATLGGRALTKNEPNQQQTDLSPMRASNPNHSTYRLALDLYPWQPRHTASTPIKQDPLQDLRQTVNQCTACALHETRTQTVFGVGNPKASLMIIGEAPGFYEDQQGEPFVGRAGQLLTAMLQAIGISRQTVYIANILKCRPPENRDPKPEEIKLCTGFLNQQIAIIQPKLLLAVGRVAAHYLLKTNASLESLRSQRHTYQPANIPLMVTFHPAYLLRNPSDKKKAFMDLQLLARFLQADLAEK